MRARGARARDARRLTLRLLVAAPVELVYDSDTPARSNVDVRVPARGLRIDSAEAIAAAGLPSRPDPETVEELQAKMLSPRFLDAENHPTIEFSSTDVEPTDAGLRVRGVLRMRGRDRPVTVPVRAVEVQPGLFRFSGEFFSWSSPPGPRNGRAEPAAGACARRRGSSPSAACSGCCSFCSSWRSRSGTVPCRSDRPGCPTRSASSREFQRIWGPT